uniref:RHS repeat-associated core domain-containing protein n=1 Tax=Flavobacterium sp. TaxID=239 RepID=UPI003B990B0C
RIRYTYDALGVKVRKEVDDINGTTTTDYLDGFQYKNEVLSFFPTSEGYVEFKEPARFFYVYNYTDHLGNVRMSYTDNGTAVPKILEENHYYPFGLKHENYASEIFERIKEPNGELFVLQPTERREWQYKYNGKEWQDELGLNFYDYGARNYDAAIGRWMNVDPLAEKSRRFSTYAYALNNPVYFIDPDGMEATDWYRNKLTGKVIWVEGSKAIKGYTHLGFSYSDQSYGKNKTDHLVMDGATKRITINGNLVSDHSKSSAGSIAGGFAIADGGNNQDPSSLRNGGRNAEWVDFGGLLGLIDLLLGREPGKATNPKGTMDKGTNGGMPTQTDKINDAVDAVGAGTGTAKEVDEATQSVNKKEVKPEQTEFVRTAYDATTGNSTYVRKDIYDAQKKKKNEN